MVWNHIRPMSVEVQMHYSALKQGKFLYTYTPTVQNMATVPKPPSTLARMATVDSLTVPFGRLEEIMSFRVSEFDVCELTSKSRRRGRR